MNLPITAESFSNLYHQYEPWVRHKLRRKGIPPADLEDVGQLAWYYAWKYRDQYDPRHHVQVFLSLNVTSAAGLYWRAKSAQPVTVLALEDVAFDDNGQATGYAPRSRENAEMAVIVRDVLSKMPPRWRSALEMEVRGEMDTLIAEIGAPATFQLLYRARQRFREIWNNGVVKDRRRCAAAA